MVQETPKARANRELIELLNELRVALPGTQVLFAFLLALPFQQRFHIATRFERDVYFVSLATALVSSGFLIAPSAYHRLNFRRLDKEDILQFANRCVIVGIGFLAVAMVSVMLLIGTFLFGAAAGVVTAALAAAILSVLWVLLPLRHRLREGPGVAPADGPEPAPAGAGTASPVADSPTEPAATRG